MSLTVLADELREDAADLGRATAALNAAAWAAGVMPEATAALIGAALTLGATARSLSAPCDPVPDDMALIGAGDDLTAGAADMLCCARSLRSDAVADYEAACENIAIADDAGEDASAIIREAMRRIADCEAAIESLDVTIARLDYAMACLCRLPDDMEDTYEPVLEHVRSGGTLPHRGDFLPSPELVPA